ncbi:amino acid adenylation domain-containing protein [Nocardia sp. NPDC051570]|uniref:amino acid adenylation domain-containing protein n=1 Tax=Nocardia sp. NPDC051570 TaxID=3364324 RepID=UPI0037A1E316
MGTTEASLPRLRCHIIGDELIAAECAEILIREQFTVLSIVTESAELRSWCHRNGIQCTSAGIEAVDEYLSGDYEYLFSIANLRMLPGSILNRPTEYAVNFHDSILPRNAGINAPSWALINGDRFLGATWHIMQQSADTGDILEQEEFEILDDDTAHTLNIKCADAAVRSFDRLVRSIRHNQLRRRPQDLDLRTVHRSAESPPRGGIIDWNDSARTIERLVRACDFGGRRNSFGVAYTMVDDVPVIIGTARSSTTRFTRRPGTISRNGIGEIMVATADYDLVIEDITTELGKVIDGPIVDRWIAAGTIADSGSDELAESARSVMSRLKKYERHWARLLHHLRPLDIRLPAPERRGACQRFEQILAAPAGAEFPLGQLVFAALCVNLDLLSLGTGVDVTVASAVEFAEAVIGTRSIATHVPFRIPSVLPDDTLSTYAEKTIAALEYDAIRASFFRDIRLRHRALPHVEDTRILLDVFGGGKEPDDISPYEIAVIFDAPAACLRVVTAERDGNELFGAELIGFVTRAIENSSTALTNIPLIARTQKAIDRTGSPAGDVPVSQMISAQALRSPDCRAVSCENDSLTYAQLEALANHIAVTLAEYQVRPGDRVGVYLPRSATLVAVLLGILKAGAEYVPFDPTYPRSRIAHMVSDAGVAVVVTSRAFDDLVLDGDHTELRIEDLQVAPTGIHFSDHSNIEGVAYTIYTSGSTGTPKGVSVGHRSLMNLLRSMRERPGLTSSDRMLALTTVCFDIAALELWLPLTVGAELRIADETQRQDPNALRALLHEYRPTIMQATPTTWKMLIASGWPGDPDLTALCGGEAVTPEVAEELVSRVRDCWNMYGPTETTIWSSADRLGRGIAPVIGDVIDGTTFHILNARLYDLPVGTVGELYIGGTGLAHGYLNRPSLTALRFVADPNRVGQRMYRTGDLVRRVDESRSHYVSRTDGQTKLRGHRVELNEIENAISGRRSVRECAVTVAGEGPDGVLVAFIATCPESDVDDWSDLRRYLRTTLPSYMVPSRYISVDALPRTLNGKIDRATLPVLADLQSPSAPKVPSGITPREETIWRIWAEVLGDGQFGIDDNFFDVGGTSLSANHIARRVRDSVDSYFSRVDIFRYPTVSLMARNFPRPVDSASDSETTGRSHNVKRLQARRRKPAERREG